MITRFWYFFLKSDTCVAEEFFASPLFDIECSNSFLRKFLQQISKNQA